MLTKMSLNIYTTLLKSLVAIKMLHHVLSEWRRRKSELLDRMRKYIKKKGENFSRLKSDFLAPNKKYKKRKNNISNVSVINHFKLGLYTYIVRHFNLRKQKFLVNMAFNFRDSLQQAFFHYPPPTLSQRKYNEKEI